MIDEKMALKLPICLIRVALGTYCTKGAIGLEVPIILLRRLICEIRGKTARILASVYPPRGNTKSVLLT